MEQSLPSMMSFAFSERSTRQRKKQQIATLLSLLIFQLDDTAIARTRQTRNNRRTMLLGLLRHTLDGKNGISAVLDTVCRAMTESDWFFIMAQNKIRELENGLSQADAERVNQHHLAVQQNMNCSQ